MRHLVLLLLGFAHITLHAQATSDDNVDFIAMARLLENHKTYSPYHDRTLSAARVDFSRDDVKLGLSKLSAEQMAKLDGTKVGNGGFVVICSKNGEPVYEFLDMFLFSQNPGSVSINRKMINEDFPLNKLLDKIIQNYALIDYQGALRLYEHSWQFWTQVSNDYEFSFNASSSSIGISEQPFINDDLENVPLSIRQMVKKQQCELEQMFSSVEVNGHFYYAVKTRLFGNLPRTHRLAAVLHELLHRDFYRTDSVLSQISIGSTLFLLSLPDFSSMESPELLKWQSLNVSFKQKRTFLFSEYAGFKLRLNSDGPEDQGAFKLKFYDTGLLKEAYVEPTKVNGALLGGRALFSPSGEILKLIPRN